MFCHSVKLSARPARASSSWRWFQLRIFRALRVDD